MNIWKLLGKKEKTITPEYILKEYRKLRRTASGEPHRRQYVFVQSLCRENQDALYELVFSGKCAENELTDLIWFGRAHTGSCRKEDSLNWVPFIDRVMLRKGELPEKVQSSLEWFEKVHGW